MTENDVRARFAELMAARADTPFGDVELVSGRTLQPFSVAGHRAAEYELTRHERATLRAAVADVPPRPELSDLRPEPEELATLVLSAPDTCRRHAAALEAPAG